MIDHITCTQSSLILLWIGAAIAMAVCGVLLYSTARFRAAPDYPPDPPAKFVLRASMEVLWTSIPILILVGAAGPAVKVMVVASAACLSAPQGM